MFSLERYLFSNTSSFKSFSFKCRPSRKCSICPLLFFRLCMVRWRLRQFKRQMKSLYCQEHLLTVLCCSEAWPLLSANNWYWKTLTLTQRLAVLRNIMQVTPTFLFMLSFLIFSFPCLSFSYMLWFLFYSVSDLSESEFEHAHILLSLKPLTTHPSVWGKLTRGP